MLYPPRPGIYWKMTLSTHTSHKPSSLRSCHVYLPFNYDDKVHIVNTLENIAIEEQTDNETADEDDDE